MPMFAWPDGLAQESQSQPCQDPLQPLHPQPVDCQDPLQSLPGDGPVSEELQKNVTNGNI